jgi:sugar lactone lactonase YvrE
VDASGRGTTFFDAQELEVHARRRIRRHGVRRLVARRQDLQDRSQRAATTFFDPEDRMHLGARRRARGNVFAATGEKSVVYRIAPDGKGEPFFKTKATHATALTFDSTGRLLIATESPGRVYRVDTSGRGFLLLDTPFDEVRGLRFDAKGVLYVAAQTGRDRGGSPSTPDTDDDKAADKPSAPDSGRAPVPTVTTEITSVTVLDSTSSGSGSVREDSRAVKGAVYRIAADGLWDRLWVARRCAGRCHPRRRDVCWSQRATTARSSVSRASRCGPPW